MSAPGGGAALPSLDPLVREALPHFGLAPDCKLALITRRENAVYRIESTSGAQYALRLHRPGYQSMQSVRSELLWLDALRSDGIDTPRAVTGAGGQRVFEVSHPDVTATHLCVLFPWLDGEPLDGADVETFATLGSINARLHDHACRWTPPDGFLRQRWDLPGMLGQQATLGAFEDLAALTDGERALLIKARTAIETKLEAFGQGPDRFGLVHGDMMPDNVLVHEGVPRVIDFDDCGFGWFAYDLATLLTMQLERHDYDQLRTAWLRGYRSVRALPDAHLAVVDALIVARQMVLVGWMHSRADTPAAKAATRWAIDAACTHASKLLAS